MQPLTFSNNISGFEWILGIHQMSARTSKEVLGGVLVEMQTINNQTVKTVLLSNSVYMYFIKT